MKGVCGVCGVKQPLKQEVRKHSFWALKPSKTLWNGYAFNHFDRQKIKKKRKKWNPSFFCVKVWCQKCDTFFFDVTLKKGEKTQSQTSFWWLFLSCLLLSSKETKMPRTSDLSLLFDSGINRMRFMWWVVKDLVDDMRKNQGFNYKIWNSGSREK